jgi:cysteine desulfuration protein SufE
MSGHAAATSVPATLQTIRESLSLFDDWEDRYRFIIELGRDLSALPDADKTAENIVHGCQSQVWITSAEQDGHLHFKLDSDALIVRGLIAILLAAYNDRTPTQILRFDIDGLFADLDLLRHLSPTRGNGLAALVRRIRQIAATYAARQG